MFNLPQNKIYSNENYTNIKRLYVTYQIGKNSKAVKTLLLINCGKNIRFII